MIEHLNAEIVLDTIRNLEDAIKWLRTTFFYVRAIRNPMTLESAVTALEGGAVPAFSAAAASDAVNIEKCLQSKCRNYCI